MSIRIKANKQKSIKVKTKIAVPESLNVVNDVDISQVRDGYILMYDDTQQRYVFRDPDDILSKAVSDNALPQEFIDKLDTDLDNKINLDAGEF
jgi:hypothetical protein